ncbi:hypothetical protein RLV_1173 (plasmid) [Rhizobium leguminosarum bv. viciae]|nr:hypothetical protein RLV_1173 [Rhizobium leguminosarum bv. viciae]
MNAEQYGDRFIDDDEKRLGVGDSSGGWITVVRSVVDPNSSSASFEPALREADRHAPKDHTITCIRTPLARTFVPQETGGWNTPGGLGPTLAGRVFGRAPILPRTYKDFSK